MNWLPAGKKTLFIIPIHDFLNFGCHGPSAPPPHFYDGDYCQAKKRNKETFEFTTLVPPRLYQFVIDKDDFM